jgi:hypothetical protein
MGLAALGTAISEPSPWAASSSESEASSFSMEIVDTAPSESAAALKLPLDPLFAVELQEAFGPPLDASFLQLLSLDEILSVEIPRDLARQLFEAWRLSLQTRLCAKPDFIETAPAAAFVREEGPRTVLAPNAVAYYENRELERVLRESSAAAAAAMSQPKKVCSMCLCVCVCSVFEAKLAIRINFVKNGLGLKQKLIFSYFREKRK